MASLSTLISIAIPVYEMKGQGVAFLDFSLEKISRQTYKDIQVVISDHSVNIEIGDLCRHWSKKLNIKYIKNTLKRGSSSANINNAMDYCDGKIIKILFQDDFLFSEQSIEDIMAHFTTDHQWLVSSCTHTNDGLNFYNDFSPRWNDMMYKGENTISSPSVLSVRNNTPERFNEELIWLMDCDFYMQLYNKYGPPAILDTVNVANRLWGNRLSDTIPQEVKEREKAILSRKYNNSFINRDMIIYSFGRIKNIVKTYLKSLQKSSKG